MEDDETRGGKINEFGFTEEETEKCAKEDQEAQEKYRKTADYRYLHEGGPNPEEQK